MWRLFGPLGDLPSGARALVLGLRRQCRAVVGGSGGAEFWEGDRAGAATPNGAQPSLKLPGLGPPTAPALIDQRVLLPGPAAADLS